MMKNYIDEIIILLILSGMAYMAGIIILSL
jgi:hypothetical protein